MSMRMKNQNTGNRNGDPVAWTKTIQLSMKNNINERKTR